MCGIVGYIGSRSAAEIIIGGLKRLEYRGYDSSGLALVGDELFYKKTKGKIKFLEEKIDFSTVAHFRTGIGHTRWATHGAPSDINAHPHFDCKQHIAVVHNGIIENYAAIKTLLMEKGHCFASETDTEVIAHLIEMYYQRDNSLLEAVRNSLPLLEGTYGILVISVHEPGKIIAARKGSPLIVGIGSEELFVASDASAVVEHTRRVVYLDDGEIAEITAHGFTTYDFNKKLVQKDESHISWDIKAIEKQGFPHFMLKEIFEQPHTIRNAFRGRALIEEGEVRLDGLRLTPEEFGQVQRILFVACGTSWHAGLVGEYLIEEFARIPVEVEYASEFRYRKPVLRKGDLVFVISQSGETADTLAALREAKSRGVKVLGITNVVGSTIARETDGGVYIHAGPEIGVASTKAFTSQIVVIVLIALLFARKNDMPREEVREYLRELEKIPELVQTVLDRNDEIREIAEKYYTRTNFLYLGRGVNFPVALEGALKLKEISYIHAEGYPAAEMKHGPIALIDEHMPVVFIAIKDEVYRKIISNMEEVRARKGEIIAIATEGDSEIHRYASHVIYIPTVSKLFSPLLTVIPLQLLAYHIAVLRGCSVDEPRNLAKSVTVE
ncbi:MAG: glutamine--fructose-6-phosphate transaminase (isomerizing) [Spirochaetes bacterium]|nr:glutamine--fructose-6-phosphate transaminase (isomerizing) [Spirochaetota bacterium]